MVAIATLVVGVGLSSDETLAMMGDADGECIKFAPGPSLWVITC